jgi:hypothetical protein
MLNALLFEHWTHSNAFRFVFSNILRYPLPISLILQLIIYPSLCYLTITQSIYLLIFIILYSLNLFTLMSHNDDRNIVKLRLSLLLLSGVHGFIDE